MPLVIGTEQQLLSFEVTVEDPDHQLIVRVLVLVWTLQQTHEGVVLRKGKYASVVERLGPFHAHERTSHLAHVLDCPTARLGIPLHDETADDFIRVIESLEFVEDVRLLQSLETTSLHHGIEDVYLFLGHVRLDSQ